MKQAKWFTLVCVTVLTLVGCGTNNQDTPDDNMDAQNNRQMEQQQGNVYGGQGGGTQNDGQMQRDGSENDGQMQDRNQNGDQQGNQNGDGRMDVADEASNQISEMDEVQRANVIVTNQNAYVAVMLSGDEEGEEVTDELEEQISNKVQESDDNIDNVFVSSNPDFVERMNGFADRIQNGEPVQGLFDEVNESIQRVFPNAN
ncbi:YhcN/YlaJ family sporulation lipoprotein [Shouchella shacheensis]|uniref:YhcN/YlaJ family sporulation lipoprotein n=1 Tax=Shouchella shacheensis TaxID=1649580 RepID=UPI00073FEB7B|nr:YhcN/YlaJ family sporulation lipoprotein [Shouchella shacheensis]